MTSEKKFTSMDDLLDNVLQQAANYSQLSVDEKYKVNNAGGKVLRKSLKSSIVDNQHVRKTSNSSHKHLKDSVFISKKDENGIRTGSVRVGFDKNHAYLARWLNDGTKGHPTGQGANNGIIGDHFVENTRLNAKGLVADAVNTEIRKIFDDRQ